MDLDLDMSDICVCIMFTCMSACKVYLDAVAAAYSISPDINVTDYFSHEHGSRFALILVAVLLSLVV